MRIKKGTRYLFRDWDDFFEKYSDEYNEFLKLNDKKYERCD